MKELQSEPASLAYVLTDESDENWMTALDDCKFSRLGAVSMLARPNSESPLDPRTQGLQDVQCFPACLLVEGTLNFQLSSLIRHIPALIEDTVQNSDDCLLKTRLAPSEIVHLFALNPGQLTVFVTVSDDRPTGILVGDTFGRHSAGHIEYLGVHSTTRRSSIGTTLVAAFQEAAEQSDLSVAVHEDNQGSMQFFGAQNFQRSQVYQLWTRDI